MSVVELERLRNRVKELEEKLKSVVQKGKLITNFGTTIPRGSI